MATTYTVCIDWDQDGSFATAGDDVTAYVRDVYISVGIRTPHERVAETGSCVILVDNNDEHFTPELDTSDFYPNVLPMRPVRVQATTGASTYTLFYGFIESILPDPGTPTNKDLTCRIMCTDLMAALEQRTARVPMLFNRLTSQLLDILASLTLNGVHASAVGEVPTNIDWFKCLKTYTFVASVGITANQVLDDARRCWNLAAAINGTAGRGTTYGTNTVKQTIVKAKALNATEILLIAYTPGDQYNVLSWQIEYGGGAGAASGGFSGGADAPAGIWGSASYQVGKETIDIAGDMWSDERVNALDMIREIVHSEYGYLWVSRSGALTFKNRDWYFSQANATPVIDSAQSHTFEFGEMTVERVLNRISVPYNPRREQDVGVVATADEIIAVPGLSGGPRNTVHDMWQGAGMTPFDVDEYVPEPEDVIINLQYRAPDSGRFIGAFNIQWPEPGTDYDVNDKEDGSGTDFTNSDLIDVHMVEKGAGVELTFENTHSATLYVLNLQIRGASYWSFEGVDVKRDNATSIDDYGERPFTFAQPLQGTSNLASSIAEFMLGRHKDPHYEIDYVQFEGFDQEYNYGDDLFDVDIGDTIKTAKGTQEWKLLVLGIDCQLHASEDSSYVPMIRFYTHRMDNFTYWILDDTTYSVLGSTTRLAL